MAATHSSVQRVFDVVLAPTANHRLERFERQSSRDRQRFTRWHAEPAHQVTRQLGMQPWEKSHHDRRGVAVDLLPLLRLSGSAPSVLVGRRHAGTRLGLVCRFEE